MAPPGFSHSRTDPTIKRSASLVNTNGFGSRDSNHILPSCVIRLQTPTEGSEQSLHLLSQNDSLRSNSPLGDIVPSDRGPAGVLRSAVRIMSVKRKGSLSSLQSEGKKHVLLHNVGRTIQRTGSQLRKTRLFHFFYLLVLPVYTLIGAIVFQALDGEHDDRLVEEFKLRCKTDRDSILAQLQNNCTILNGTDCFEQMLSYLNEVEDCYRQWHLHNRTMTHSMSDFTNALVYAFSVYTTIGYGNMAADTTRCRLATIAYGALGIPLFFAFVKEEGNLCRNVFIALYNKIRKARKNCRCPYDEREKVLPAISEPSSNSKPSPLPLSFQTTHPPNCLTIPLSPNIPLTPQLSPSSAMSVISDPECSPSPKPTFCERESRLQRFQRNHSGGSLLGTKAWLDEQRRVFLAGVVVFIVYILTASAVFSITTEFDYVTSVYFLFNSVALIGFGDVFPKNPRTILIYAVFMILGVVLFSMCYFILQEEIREKAFEASRKARMSISKYSHTIVQHARSPWSRRNSPLYEGPTDSAFDRLKKRRQSAPAVAITAPTGKTRFRDI